jgi:hypothetical protein
LNNNTRNTKYKNIPAITVAFAILFALLSTFLFFNKKFFSFSPWSDIVDISWPSYASGNEQRRLVVADSGTSVIVMSIEGQLLYRLESASDSFTLVKFAEFDADNNLYILDIDLKGVLQENVERVLKYSEDGKLLGEIYVNRYINDEFIVTKGKISGMVYYNGFIYFVRLRQYGWSLERTSAKVQMPETVSGDRTDTDIIHFFNYPNAFRDFGYFHLNAETRLITFTTKSGGVKQYDFNGNVVYEYGDVLDTFSLPWTAVSDSGGNIIYTDILNEQIVYVNTKTETRKIIYNAPNDSGNFYRINYAFGILYASPKDAISSVALFSHLAEGQYTFEQIVSYSYPKNMHILRIALFCCFFLDILLLLLLLISFILFLFVYLKIRIGKSFGSIMLAAACIAFGAVISSVLIINEMNQRYNEKTYDALENISRLIAASIDAEVIDNLELPSQSESVEYLEFKRKIQERFTKLSLTGKRAYQTIQKAKNGKMYSVHDMENLWDAYYPIGQDDESYNEIANSKQYYRSQIITTDGNWIFTRGPILNKQGEVIALIETGYDMEFTQKQTQKVVIKTVFIVGCTAIVLLALVSILIWMSHKRQAKHNKEGSL